MARKTIGFVHLEWTCPNCGNRNQGTHKTCQSCGSPQPENVAFEQARKQELIKEEAEIEKAKKGPDIHCPYCGARNVADAKTCVQCGGDLVGGVRRESGRVVGAFSTQPETVKQIACPHCGAENPETNATCKECGGSLTPVQQAARTGGAPGSAPTPAPVPAPRQKSPVATGCGIAGIIGIALLGIAIFIFIFSMLLKKESAGGTVQNVSWERMVEIQALSDVSRSDWRDEIPSDARIEGCEEKIHHEQDSPASNAIEVCGTPYTIDTGSGAGEVVQDCVYQVYAEYCDYTVKDWQTVDQIALQGNDLNPVWPQVNLSATEREGDFTEKYTIILQTSDDTYTYTTSDYDLFIQCQPGSRWILTINAFNDVVNIEPE